MSRKIRNQSESIVAGSIQKWPIKSSLLLLKSMQHTINEIYTNLIDASDTSFNKAYLNSMTESLKEQIELFESDFERNK